MSRQWRTYNKLYRAVSILVCIFMTAALVYAVSWLPPTGERTNPAENEVPERYITKGLEETGAVNIVSGMILNYRAFDTFGESTVLFTATGCVMCLLMLADVPGSEKNAGAAEGEKRGRRPGRYLRPYPGLYARLFFCLESILFSMDICRRAAVSREEQSSERE